MRRRFGLVLLLGTLATAGCGSSSSNGPAFITQLNTLCSQGNAAVRGAGSISAAADTFQRYLVKVKALAPPEGLKSTFSQFASLLDRRLALLRRQKLAAAKQLHQHISALATRMGAVACAK